MADNPRQVSLDNMEMMPKGIKYLLLFNAGFFLLTVFLYGAFQFNLVNHLGLFHPHSDKFSYYQFVTHLFMHGSGLHIFLNMFVLWMFGSVLEHVWGLKRFLIYFFFTGLGAALLHNGVRTIQINQLEEATLQYVQAPSYENFKAFEENEMGALPRDFKKRLETLKSEWQESPDDPVLAKQSTALVQDYKELYIDMPTVGASGAVYGVLLAFGMLFPNIYVYLYLLIPIRAKYFVLMIALLQLYLGFFDKTSNVANFAHLGGMVFGFILLKIWGAKPMTIVKE